MDTELSAPHRQIASWLSESGVRVINEKPFAQYKADIYLPDYHCIVEIDGIGHTKKKSEARDDFFMVELGIPTYRINLAKKKLKKEEVISLVVKFGEAYNISLKDRKAMYTKWASSNL